MAYMTYKAAAEEIKNVINNEMGEKGLLEVQLVYDREGKVNNISVIFDARVKKDIWDDVRVYDFRMISAYKRVVVQALSNSFAKKLEEVLDEKNKNILAASRGKRKYLFVVAANAECLKQEL